MKRIVVTILLALTAIPAFGSTHKDTFTVPCNELWRAVKDTLRNSGKYGIIAIDDKELTASYNIGGNLTGKRINSAVLNDQNSGVGCELQVQTAYSGLVNNDYGDFKKRVDDSLTKLKGQPLTATEDKTAPAAAPAQASLAIDSTPTGADIEIDGSFVGNSPSTIDVKPGSHQINVKKKWLRDWTRTLNITGRHHPPECRTGCRNPCQAIELYANFGNHARMSGRVNLRQCAIERQWESPPLIPRYRSARAAACRSSRRRPPSTW